MLGESAEDEHDLPSGSVNSCENFNDDQSRRNTTIKRIDETVDQLISSIKWPHFKELYRVAYEKDRGILKALYAQTRKDMKTRIKEEISKSVLTDDFLSSLDRLDQLEKSAENTNQSGSWRPSRNPKKDMSSQLISEKMKEKTVLENALKDLKLRNEKIRQDNFKDYQKICEHEQHLQNAESTWQKIACECEKLPFELN